MKYQAVIFDLGGTLVIGPSWSDYFQAAKEMANILSAPEDEFTRIWSTDSEGLSTGVFSNYQAYIRHACKQLQLDIAEHLIDLAAGIPFSITKQKVMIPREGALELLTYLKSEGYKTGLISDCASDLPEIWPDTPFASLIDVATFSCSEGMSKRDPRIFQHALEELSVVPEMCLYIADGNRNELANAAGLGMRAIRIYVPGEIDEINSFREDWNGPEISSLREIRELLE